MTALTDLISAGGGGAVIGEYASFVDQGTSFTDGNGAVWLRSGSVTLDTTTYPDASSASVPASYNSYFQATNNWNASVPTGISVSGDWALTLAGNANTFSQMNLATNTVNDAGTAISVIASNAKTVAIGYITCTGPNVVTAQANTDNKFAAVVRDWNNPARMLSFNLDGYDDANSIGSGSINQDSVISHTYLYKPNGQSIMLNSLQVSGGLHWDGPNKKLYFFVADAAQGSLYVYDYTGETWGTSNASGPSTINADTEIDYFAESTVSRLYSLSASSTDLFIAYLPSPGTGSVTKIRKIPLSGNLSWASGSDIADFGKVVTNALYPQADYFVEDSQGNVTIDTNSYASQGFYEMDGSDYTFLSGSTKLYQWKSGDIIGSTTTTQVGPATGVTFYQRIK
jgi:hypothetical protein